jgi:ferrous iron transport protein B
MAWLFKKTLLRGEPPLLIMELPPYKRPLLKIVVRHMWDRSKLFLRRAGTVILGVAIVLWVLSHLPLKDGKPPEQIADSFAGMIGHTIEPAIKPLGFNWKIGIGLISSIAAREVIVGTLGTIYGMEGTAQSEGLQKALQNELTMGGAIALLIFFAFAMQCMSTVAVVRRETGGWKWPAIQFAYMTALAFVAAFVVNHLIRVPIV